MKKIYALLLVFIMYSAWGQEAGDLDSSFNYTYSSPVKKIVSHPSGNYVVITDNNHVLKISPTGTIMMDLTFSFTVNTVYCQTNGGILIGGPFVSYTYNGTTYRTILRYTETGAFDSGFNCSSSMPYVYFSPSVIKEHLDTGYLLIGGAQTVDETGIKLLYRINGTTGAIDSSFNSFPANSNPVMGSGINTISVYSDGRILVGGKFPTGYVARLSSTGIQDSYSLTGISGTTPNIYASAILSDESILLGGSFTHTSSNRKAFLKTNSTGTVLAYGYNFPTTSIVRDIKVQNCESKILVCGSFTQGIKRLNLSDGTNDTSFNSGIGANTNSINSIALSPNEDIFIAGAFTAYNSASFPAALSKLNGNLNSGANAVSDSASITTAGGSTASVLANDFYDGVAATSSNITLTLVSPSSPTPATGAVNLITAPLSSVYGKVIVAAGTTAGTYYLKYRISKKDSSCYYDEATIRVTVTSIVLDAVNDSYATNGIELCNGTTISSNILNNDKINGFNLYPSSVSSINLTYTSPDPGITIDTTNGSPTKGKITVAPGVHAGTYLITYRITDKYFAQNYDEATISLILFARADAVNDAVTVNSGTNNNNVINVLSNDTYDCHGALQFNEISITETSTLPPGIYLNTQTGNLSVDSTVPPGVYTFSYTICDNVFSPALSCDTATVTITVNGPAPIDAVNDSLTVTLGSTATINIYTNDTYTGGITPTLLSTPGGGISVNISTGVVNVPSSTPAGTYTFTYQICQQGFPTNCDTAVVTITVGAGLRTKSNHDDNLIQDNSVTIYPNPSEGLYNIDFKGYDAQKFDITIHNTLGQLVYQGVITSENTNQIDLTRFESGSYYITLVNNSEIINKIVIKK